MEEQNKKMISYRDYVTDTIDVAAIIAKNATASHWLEQLQSAFEQPRSTPYLGRKSNPLSAPLTEIGERTIDIKSLDELAERLASRLEDEKIGNLRCSEYLLRTPKELFKSTSKIRPRWTLLGEKSITDQRSSNLRFFSSRYVVDHIAKSKGGEHEHQEP